MFDAICLHGPSVPNTQLLQLMLLLLVDVTVLLTVLPVVVELVEVRVFRVVVLVYDELVVDSTGGSPCLQSQVSS